MSRSRSRTAGAAVGATAELMVPKWFNKDPKLSADETVGAIALRAAFRARPLSRAARFDTAFGLHAACYDHQIARCARADIPALAAGYGPAEIDKAILDALLRAQGMDIFTGLNGNIAGLDARLTPDIDDGDHRKLPAPCASRRRAFSSATRSACSTRSMALAAIHAESGCRYFKIKLSGDPVADRDRLIEIVEALTDLGIDYRLTLDANEQYPSHKALTALVDALLHDDAFEHVTQRLLYIEQPLPREMTWDMPLGDLGKSFAFIIDEADVSYDAFPRALKLGYRGVSSKSCKGIYKSLLNGARAAYWNAMDTARAFVTAEDLTCQAGLAIQQDTALVAFHGLIHAERNGHHYVDGFSNARMPRRRHSSARIPISMCRTRARCDSPCATARSTSPRSAARRASRRASIRAMSARRPRKFV